MGNGNGVRMGMRLQESSKNSSPWNTVLRIAELYGICLTYLVPGYYMGISM